MADATTIAAVQILAKAFADSWSLDFSPASLELADGAVCLLLREPESEIPRRILQTSGGFLATDSYEQQCSKMVEYALLYVLEVAARALGGSWTVKKSFFGNKAGVQFPATNTFISFKDLIAAQALPTELYARIKARVGAA